MDNIDELLQDLALALKPEENPSSKSENLRQISLPPDLRKERNFSNTIAQATPQSSNAFIAPNIKRYLKNSGESERVKEKFNHEIDNLDLPPPLPPSPPPVLDDSLSNLELSDALYDKRNFTPSSGAHCATFNKYGQGASSQNNNLSQGQLDHDGNSRGQAGNYDGIDTGSVSDHQTTKDIRDKTDREYNRESSRDSFTNMLVDFMDDKYKLDDNKSYGTCVKCHKKVLDAADGCTAINKLYHYNCFKCYVCRINLEGKSFYAVGGEPYCEDDYLATLEKCAICQKVVTGKLLKGKDQFYHPECFRCVACGKTLAGLPFTANEANDIYCIEDYSRKYMPKCWGCKQLIIPPPGEVEVVRIIAMDHSFHIECFKCEDCGFVFSQKGENGRCYPIDGRLLCLNCNTKRSEYSSK